MYEVQAGQLASMRASMPELKKFAKDMVRRAHKDDKRVEIDPCQIRSRNHAPSELDSTHEGLLDDLKGAKDEDFDGRYIAQQISAHNEALILMRAYANSGDNADIKTFAEATCPGANASGYDQRYRSQTSRRRRPGAQQRNSTTR